MSKGSLLIALVLLLQACFARRFSLLLSSRRLAGGQIGDGFLCQDPIRALGMILSRGHNELDGAGSDSIIDDELSDEGVFVGGEFVSNNGSESLPDGEADAEEGEGLLQLDVDDHGGGGVDVKEEERFVPLDGDGGGDAEEDEGLLLLDGGDGVDDDDEAEKDGLHLIDGGDGDGEDDDYAKESSGELASGGDVQCPECGKFFKNDKSMFGHLRSHPNRGYKGATPPVKKLKLSPDMDIAAPALSSPLSVDQPLAQYNQRDPQLTPFEILCACVMLTFRSRDNQAMHQESSLPSFSERKHDTVEQVEGAIGGLVTSNVGAEVKSNPEAEVKSNAGAEANDAMLLGAHGSSAVVVPKKKRGRNNPKEDRDQGHRKVKLVPPTKEKRPYICKHCKAEFPTHQALGGHMAGHHREKRNLVLNEKETWQTYQVLLGESHRGNQGKVSDESCREGLLLSSRRLQAEQLRMGWQSGHAPGGYMMQHSGQMNAGPSPVVAPLPPVSDEDRRRPLDIDLNVQAPEQD